MTILSILLLIWNILVSFILWATMIGAYKNSKDITALRTWIEFFWGLDFDKISEWISHEEWKQRQEEQQKKEIELLEKIRKERHK